MLLLPTARNSGADHRPLFESWKSTCELIGRSYERFRQRDFGVAAQARTIVNAANAASAAGTAASPRDKAEALYRYVRDQIETISGFQGTTGVYNMSPTVHQGITVNPFLLASIIGGRVIVVK